MKKEEIYLDMSKLTESQQVEIISMLPKTKDLAQYHIGIINGIKCYYLMVSRFNTSKWVVAAEEFLSAKYGVRLEITYKQFKELYPTFYKY